MNDLDIVFDKTVPKIKSTYLVATNAHTLLQRTCNDVAIKHAIEASNYDIEKMKLCCNFDKNMHDEGD